MSVCVCDVSGVPFVNMFKYNIYVKATGYQREVAIFSLQVVNF